MALDPFHVAPTALDSRALMLGPVVPNYPTELATHLQRRMHGARSASPRARTALANPPMTIRRI